MRPRQWVKNAFVAAPLFFTPEALNANGIYETAVAVIVFCLLSSAVYVVNDYCDRDADRLHPEKRHRPIASGEVSAGVAMALAVVLLAGAAILSLTQLPHGFAPQALAYFLLNVLYSLKLKHVAILDVLIVAAGFVLRVSAGASAIEVNPSVWIMICTGLLALFLAVAKRRDDLVKTMSDAHRPSLAGYNLRFVDASLAMILGALLVSYLIYTTDTTVITRFGTDKLYITAPFVAAGVLRYLQITLVEERSGSPTEIALTDKFLILAVVGWAATFAILMYA